MSFNIVNAARNWILERNPFQVRSPTKGVDIDKILNELFLEFPYLKEARLEKNQYAVLALWASRFPRNVGDITYDSEIFEERRPSLEQFKSRVRGLSDEILIDFYKSRYSLDCNLKKIVDAIQQKKIIITSSVEEIISNFNLYNIIVLRDMGRSNILLLGCGANCDRHTSNDHKNMDSIDINIYMSPSIVAFWGSPKLNQYFSDKHLSYDAIVDEGPIVAFNQKDKLHQERFFEGCRRFLNKSGLLFIPEHLFSENFGEDLLSIIFPKDFYRNLTPLDSSWRNPLNHQTYRYCSYSISDNRFANRNNKLKILQFVSFAMLVMIFAIMYKKTMLSKK